MRGRWPEAGGGRATRSLSSRQMIPPAAKIRAMPSEEALCFGFQPGVRLLDSHVIGSQALPSGGRHVILRDTTPSALRAPPPHRGGGSALPGTLTLRGRYRNILFFP